MIANYKIAICQHGAGYFTNYGNIDLYDYLISEKEKWDKLNLDVKGLAYPNHARNSFTKIICGSLFGVCFSGGVDFPFVYQHNTSGSRSNIFDLYRISLYSTSENELKSACDYAKANNKLVPIFWHDNDIVSEESQITKLKNVIDYAKNIGLTFVSAGDVLKAQ